MKKLVSILILAVFMFSLTAFAAEQSQNLLIPKDEIRDKIVFGAGQDITNNGTVNNDMFVAGQRISNDGNIVGDFFAAGQNIIISGPVNGSIRTVCQTLDVKSEIGRNIMMMGQDLFIENSGMVNGTVSMAGASLRVDGTINKDLNVSAGSVTINGIVNGDALIQSDNISISPSAKINGNLKYISTKEIIVPDGVVGGEISKNIIQKPAPQPKQDTAQKAFGAAWIAGKIIWFIGSFVLGALLIALFSKYFEKAAISIKTNWLKYAGIGLLILIVAPISAIILLITIIGIPVALIAMMVYVLFIAIAKIPVAVFLGDLILKNKSKYLSLLLGLFILTVLYMIPILGAFAGFIVLIVGLGALACGMFCVNHSK